MADIDRNRRDTLAELADKELEIKENNELSEASRKKNLDIIAQQRAAVNTQAAEELAKTEELIRAKQRFAIEQERVLNLTRLQQQANENSAALQDLEDQLKLIGLYGDALEDATAQIELQQQLREIEVEFQNQLLELEDKKLQIGKERYAMELANIQAVKAQSIAAANAQIAAQQRIVEARRKAERTDVRGAIGKRLEELERSVDPAVTAVEGLNSLFNNMGNALDNFVETGKFKFKDFARSIIADLAKIALKAAATQLLTKVIGGLFGGLAAGGPAMANKPYIVGEQGPELFVPNSAGRILTNATMNKNAGAGDSGMQPIVNNTYINNNISALDAKSVAQLFAENRRTLFGAVEMAKKETPYRTV
jgi:lambda family phage tail tape measure protein